MCVCVCVCVSTSYQVCFDLLKIKTLIRNHERILIKLYRQNMSLLFNQCIYYLIKHA